MPTRASHPVPRDIHAAAGAIVIVKPCQIVGRGSVGRQSGIQTVALSVVRERDGLTFSPHFRTARARIPRRWRDGMKLLISAETAAGASNLHRRLNFSLSLLSCIISLVGFHFAHYKCGEPHHRTAPLLPFLPRPRCRRSENCQTGHPKFLFGKR